MVFIKIYVTTRAQAGRGGNIRSLVKFVSLIIALAFRVSHLTTQRAADGLTRLAHQSYFPQKYRPLRRLRGNPPAANANRWALARKVEHNDRKNIR